MNAARALSALLLVAACGSDPSVHDVVTCEPGTGQCEYGCRRGAVQAMPDGMCYLADPSGSGDVPLCQMTFVTDGQHPGLRGCCVRDDEVLRFRECCELVDGAYVCPS